MYISYVSSDNTAIKSVVCSQVCTMMIFIVLLRFVQVMFKCNHNHRLSGGTTHTLNSSISAYSMNLFAIHAPF